MCTSAPATGCALESFTSPCRVEGPTGEAKAATPETSKGTKQIWSDLTIIEFNRIGNQIMLRKLCGLNPTLGSDNSLPGLPLLALILDLSRQSVALVVQTFGHARGHHLSVVLDFHPLAK